jgi:hypothetical protein
VSEVFEADIVQPLNSHTQKDLDLARVMIPHGYLPCGLVGDLAVACSKHDLRNQILAPCL